MTPAPADDDARYPDPPAAGDAEQQAIASWLDDGGAVRDGD
jgi:hypothetical protein